MVNGQRLTFEVFGLFQGVLTMIDRETRSVWNHLEGRAVEGPLRGARMVMVPAPLATWGEWKKTYAASLVLSPDTPFQDRYRGAVRLGVFSSQEAKFGDGRLAANALVVGVEVDGQFKGYPTEEIEELGGAVNDALAGQPILVIYNPVSRTGLAYSRRVKGTSLEFDNAASGGFELRDRQTGSLWDRGGRAIEGSLAGSSLNYVPSFISEWYGWSGYHPQTLLFAEAP